MIAKRWNVKLRLWVVVGKCGRNGQRVEARHGRLFRRSENRSNSLGVPWVSQLLLPNGSAEMNADGQSMEKVLEVCSPRGMCRASARCAQADCDKHESYWGVMTAKDQRS